MKILLHLKPAGLLLMLLMVSVGSQAVTVKGVGSKVERHKAFVKEGPAPVVTSWGPGEKMYPGMDLVIRGSGFKRGFVVEIVGRRTLKLRIKQRTATRVVAQIRTTDYTGRSGLPLRVYNLGGEKKVLTETFKVINRDTLYKGESYWHLSSSSASNIWSTGSVSLKLDFLDFRSSGTGTYKTKVKLVTLVGTGTKSCVSHRVKGKQEYEKYDYKTHHKSRKVSWRRLPDGRIHLSNVGLAPDRPGRKDSAFNAIATVSGPNLSFEYESAVIATKPEIRNQGGCKTIASPILGGIAPLHAVPLRSVEWSLRRVGP